MARLCQRLFGECDASVGGDSTWAVDFARMVRGQMPDLGREMLVARLLLMERSAKAASVIG